jgi:hypothetical protein
MDSLRAFSTPPFVLSPSVCHTEATSPDIPKKSLPEVIEVGWRLRLKRHWATGSSDAQQAIALRAKCGFKPILNLHLDVAIEHARRGGSALPYTAT